MNYGRRTLLDVSSSPSGGVTDANTRGGVFGPQGYGGGIFDGMSGIGQNNKPRYPWKQFSDATQSLQFATNVELEMRGMPTIATDGYLGPETCGAQKYLFEQEGLASHEPPGTCQGFRYPAGAGEPAEEPMVRGEDLAPPDAADEVLDQPKVERAGMGTTGFLLLAGAVAAGGIYLATRGKKRRR